MSIIISKKGSCAEKLDKSEFEKEDYLQNYIHENPESIPVYEIEEDKKLFVVAREFSTESGPIDALAIDKDGDIYVVETKLYKNPDKRTVVAQALDYGASLWKHTNDFGVFLDDIEVEVQGKFKMSFREKADSFFKFSDDQFELMLENMKTNLKEGNMKFVILMDSIDERLKDLIIYVNQNSQFDIYAVQLEYYKFNDYEIMIPKMFGVEVKKNIGNKSKFTWTKDKVIDELKNKNSTKIVEYVKKLFELAEKENLYIYYGKSSSYGYFSMKIKAKSKTVAVISAYISKDLEFYFLCDKEFETGDLKNLCVNFAKEGEAIIPDLNKFNNIDNYWSIDLESLNDEQFSYLIDSLKNIIHKIKI